MTERIVVAEDEPEIRNNLARLLRLEGFEVFTAPNGREALELIRWQIPDLVLSDVMMPEMTGHELVQAIRGDARLAHLPTVLLTARADRSDQREGMNLGADDYLTKPFHREELLACVRSRLEKSRTQQQAAQRLAVQAHRLTHFDGVTDLPNRSHFLLTLGDLLQSQGTRADGPLLWAVALDNMTELAQIYGASQLDAWLYRMSLRLQTAAEQWPQPQGGRCSVARIGEDRFAVLMPQQDGAINLEEAAAELVQAMQQPLLFEGSEQFPRVAVGLYPAGNDQASATAMLSRLELALSLARGRQPQRIAVYRPELAPEVSAAYRLHNDMHRAVERGELRAMFQPQVDAKSGEAVGFEALIRWRHPELGLVPPLKFIPLAEDNGQIVGMGEWMLRKACREAMAWQALAPTGATGLRVAVNLSARQFSDPNLTRHIEEALEQSGLAAQYLELEITEGTAMLDLQHTLDLLRRFKAKGLKLAIDDFGTGYSSLAYLKRFPLDILKIDQSFVRHLCNDRDDQAIARAVTTLAHSLGLKVIAEGVETQEQQDLLVEMGCDQIQGYLHGKPMAPTDALAWLQARQPGVQAG